MTGGWSFPLSGTAVYIQHHIVAQRRRAAAGRPCQRRGVSSAGTPAAGRDFRRPARSRPRRSLEGRRVSVEEKVIEIVCENLGVNKEQVTRNTSSSRTSGPTRSTSSNWSWSWKRSSRSHIPDDQAEKIKTVGEAIDYIEREIKKK